jgi:ADP-heptose:LPS heptosyltransferase
MHVGTIAHDGLESRRWPLDHFARVAEWLFSRGYEVTAIAGPAERNETRRLQEFVPSIRLFEGSLPETARFLSTARLSITNDSGIGHLAAAAGTHVVALFGPTPVEHAPYGPNVTALRPSLCPPCFDVRVLNTDCKLGLNYACLKQDLTVDHAVRCVAALLERRGSRAITGEAYNGPGLRSSEKNPL